MINTIEVDSAAAVAVLTLSLAWPFAQGLFQFGPLHLDDLALTVASGCLLLVDLEAAKPFGGAGTDWPEPPGAATRLRSGPRDRSGLCQLQVFDRSRRVLGR